MKMFVILIVLFGVLQARGNNDVTIGEITESSVLVHSERVIEDYGRLEWSYESDTPLRITRIEAIDQKNGNGGELYLTNGGPGFRRVTLYFRNRGIDFIVNIYGEPQTNNDFTFGVLSETSILIHSGTILAEVEGSQYGYIYWQGDIPITRLEVLDQNNGIGGFVFDVVLFNEKRNVYVPISGQPIEFIVNIYGEPLPPTNNDVIIGELTDSSVLVHSERVIDDYVRLEWRFESETPLRITRIEAFDQRNGTGAELYLTNGGLGFRRVTLYFRNLGIDFIVNIYGEPQTNNDFTFGVLSDASILIHSDTILAEFEGSQYGYIYWQGDIPITKLEVLDQNNGTGGFVFDVMMFNENRNVYVPISGQPIEFIVNIYGEMLPHYETIGHSRHILD